MKTILALCLMIAGALAQESFITIDQMMQTLPLGIKLRQGKHWQYQSAALANEALKKNVVGKEVRMQLTFPRYEVWEKSAYGQAIVGQADIPGLVVTGSDVQPMVFVYFRMDQLARMGLTTARRSDVFTGKVGRADFTEGKFNLDVFDARLDNAPVVKRLAAKQDATLVGQRWTWGSGTIQFGADGIVRTGDGEWERRGLVTSWQHLGNGNVLLKIEKGRSDQLIALLQFNPAWTAYTGWGFNGAPIKEEKRAP